MSGEVAFERLFDEFDVANDGRWLDDGNCTVRWNLPDVVVTCNGDEQEPETRRVRVG